VETSNLEQVKEALDADVDIIMLDNMSSKMMKEAVQLINNRAKIEASGNMTLKSDQKSSGNRGKLYFDRGTHPFSKSARY
jgi:nicotinate-nucleotide pyrophosphorylase (carboxylating)